MSSCGEDEEQPCDNGTDQEIEAVGRMQKAGYLYKQGKTARMYYMYVYIPLLNYKTH